MSNYSEKLKDPKWQKKRLEILQRDEFICTNCGDNENELHVHHKTYTYNTDIWDYKNELLTTLCKNCHENITSVKKEIKKIIDLEFVDEDCLSELLDIIKSCSKFSPPRLMLVNEFCEKL